VHPHFPQKKLHPRNFFPKTEVSPPEPVRTSPFLRGNPPLRASLSPFPRHILEGIPRSLLGEEPPRLCCFIELIFSPRGEPIRSPPRRILFPDVVKSLEGPLPQSFFVVFFFAGGKPPVEDVLESPTRSPPPAFSLFRGPFSFLVLPLQERATFSSKEGKQTSR